ncbi:MAG: anhydro-N-acetylmuramic acid kinase [Methylotenera sp.]|nr:anhydro-N-acetylmuramic acid kinase [Oligoflexia bacterium]
MMKTLKILGVMTGTSCDGLDAACVRFDSEGWQPLWERTYEYPKKLRQEVLKLQKPGTKVTLKEMLQLNRDLGEWYGNVLAAMNKSAEAKSRPDVIANHGQTVGHFPDSQGKGTTLQLGDPTQIAYQTGLTVVSNFRNGDMAAGGQGAPLVPLFHQFLAPILGAEKGGVAIHNIGGISNTTYIGPKNLVLAFDTGPGNLWMDAAAEIASKGKLHMDIDGLLAAQGSVDEKSLLALLKHPYFKKQPPKSTGRDDFTVEWFLAHTKAKGADLVATATALTVESIARAYEAFVLKKRLPLKNVYICGGGARNPMLLLWLNDRLPQVKFSTLEDAGLEPQFIEAQAFALYGYLSLRGQPLGGSWTGAQGFGPPGHIIPGENWDHVLKAIT